MTNKTHINNCFSVEKKMNTIILVPGFINIQIVIIEKIRWDK